MKGLAKNVAVVAVGVILAGLAMYYGRNLPLLSDARDGFDS